MEIEEAIRETNVRMCYSCGKCTLACPLTHDGHIYSPRRIVERILAYGKERIDPHQMWECLTCNACSQFCPSDVRYPVFVREIRRNLVNDGSHGECAHAGILHSIMRLMASGRLKQKRMEWLDDSLKTNARSEVLLFVGCAPYYDSYFGDSGNHIEIARSAIKLLNHIGIKPRLLKNEVCCGHDMLWSGEIETFEKLAELNTKMIDRSKVKQVVLTCPECYNTFKENYKDLREDIELHHLSDILNERLEDLQFRENGKKVTFQDSCRLGRFQGIYEPPRELLRSIPGLELVEMEDSKRKSICCGTSCWMNCDQNSKRIQVDRLDEASNIADMVVTACPKCLIHFRCAMDEQTKLDVEVKDLFVALAESLGV
ncbi:MAG: (Fe-S)-binding protein [Thermoplasmata archaeon]